MSKKREKIILGGIFIILVVIGGFITYRSSGAGKNYDELAKCLSGRGIQLYGAAYCGACNSQKEMFGPSFQYIDYTDCLYNQEKCQQNNITAYPTWLIDGNKLTGARRPEQLATITGCQG